MAPDPVPEDDKPSASIALDPLPEIEKPPATIARDLLPGDADVSDNGGMEEDEIKDLLWDAYKRDIEKKF
jgi:hypothetical protein